MITAVTMKQSFASGGFCGHVKGVLEGVTSIRPCARCRQFACNLIRIYSRTIVVVAVAVIDGYKLAWPGTSVS